jgi:hypothetical protein
MTFVTSLIPDLVLSNGRKLCRTELCVLGSFLTIFLCLFFRRVLLACLCSV